VPVVRTAGGKLQHFSYTKEGKKMAAGMARWSNGSMMRVARRRKKGKR
jgi:hypothetical protein